MTFVVMTIFLKAFEKISDQEFDATFMING